MIYTNALDSEASAMVFRRRIETNDSRRVTAPVDSGPPQPTAAVRGARPNGPVWGEWSWPRVLGGGEEPIE